MTDIPAPVPTTPAAPAKPPGVIRWWGFGLLVVLLLVIAIALPLWAGSFIHGKITEQLAANGWELDPAHPLTVSVLGGRLGGAPLTLRMIDTKETLVQMDRLNAQVALWESFTRKDLIIAELAAEGVTGSLRRGPDGRIKLLEDEEDDQAGAGTDWKSMDWKGYYEKAMQKLKERQAEKKAEEEKVAEAAKDPTKEPVTPPREAPVPDVDWPKAVKHQPLPTGDRHTPRVVIRKLSITGGKVPLPDESAFDIASFSLQGVNVAARQDVGEDMTLTGSVVTLGAGTMAVDFARRADDTGHLKLSAPTVPVAALTHPALAGAALAAYGPSGMAAVESHQHWTGWLLTGEVVAQVSELKLAPTAQAPKNAKQIAQVVDALKGRPIRWPVTIGGSLDRPTITDSGLQKVLDANQDALVDAAKEEAKDQALKEGGKLLDKELKKHPEAEKAKGAAKDALKGLLGR
jgi:hypothetical protein